MSDPLNTTAGSVPTTGGVRELVLVDGRTFCISDDGGQMRERSHGMVHDDLRHLSLFEVSIADADLEGLACTASSPLSAVIVQQVRHGGHPRRFSCVMIRRRWVADGLREDIHVLNSGHERETVRMQLRIGADFAHLFDVKAGLSATEGKMSPDDANHWTIRSAGDVAAATRVSASLEPTDVDLAAGTLSWLLELPARGESMVSIIVEPMVEGVASGVAFTFGQAPAQAVPVRRLAAWQASTPKVVSADPRISSAVSQALADIAALRIFDRDGDDRVVIAAGAPWFMTLFGRDSLLTTWMTLPFDDTLASGVLSTLADLQGTCDDPPSEEQPGKILHELRRRGGGGPFKDRDRYFGTVDATPL
ncbi:MAG: glycogen debranching N-terminal domain-containing protein, partial [Ilumatobacteraceae bacterium]